MLKYEGLQLIEFLVFVLKEVEVVCENKVTQRCENRFIMIQVRKIQKISARALPRVAEESGG